MAKTKTSPKRVVVFVEGGLAEASMDDGVTWELIDWDNIKDGHDHWTPQEIDTFAAWSKGLISPKTIARLREYAKERNNAEN